ncbi:hypothetical protein RN98_07225 [Fusobacterium animalis]|uniref:Uncharacterized protein n=1 Tax=Fusobacterium animalis TaxID=76859 RepID=A0A0M3USE8_9FUSO|nr:hypothetical protein RN98_07225 [Fusobacterium animalis]
MDLYFSIISNKSFFAVSFIPLEPVYIEQPLLIKKLRLSEIRKGAIFSLIIPYFSFNKFSSLSSEIFKFFPFNFLKKSSNFFSSSPNILFFEILQIFF